MKFKTSIGLLLLLCISNAVFSLGIADKTASVSYVLVPYRIEDKWGFSDQNGNMKISPVYDKVLQMKYYYTDGKSFRTLMVVRKGTETMVINHLNNVVVPAGKGFDSFSLDSYNYETVIVGKQNKQGVYFNGKELIPCIYDNVEKMPNLTFNLRSGQLNGLINSKGKVVVPLKYIFVSFKDVTSEKYSWAATNNLKEKPVIFEDENLHDKTPKYNELGITSLRSELLNIRKLYLDSPMKALKTDYTIVRPDNQYKHLLYVGKNGKMGLYNVILKKLVIPCEYEEVIVNANLSAEIIIKVKKGLYGFMGEWGNVQAPCIFNSIQNKEAPFLLVKGKSIGMLSESIHYIKPEYLSIQRFDSVNYAIADKTLNFFFVTTSSGKTGIINGDGFQYFKD